MNLHSFHFHSSRTRGFSIIELLIAIILIGILVSILVPVIANRSEDARIARAYQDIENLANAQERLANDTGYLGRLFILNDVSGGDGIPFMPSNWQNDIVDGIRDSLLGGGYYQNTPFVFIDSSTGEIVDGAMGDQIAFSIYRNETAFGWHGPYINWNQDRNFVDPNGTYPDGIPDDPWGNNYLLFTRQGLVLEPNGIILNSPEDVYRRFDRTTILSLGPNGVPGNGPGSAEPHYGQGDDIYRKFGF